MSHNLCMLPPQDNNGMVDVETKKILKKLLSAHKQLAELKGFSEIVPNKNILLNAITLKEAKDSSRVENIVTTHDQLFQALSSTREYVGATKEVLNYKEAIWHGINLVIERGMLTTNMIIEIQALIEGNNAGIRKQSGTVLRNDVTGEIVYTPPETEREIRSLLKNLEDYINIDDDDVDELIKMAIIHYQFESIHPFYDGNGRTGRIICILYLVLKNLIDSPILYLSKYIIENRNNYYKCLQGVTAEGNWEDWILYILEGVEETAAYSLDVLIKISALIEKVSVQIKDSMPRIYSAELMAIIFSEFYTRISNVESGLGVTRKTASLYLSELCKIGILNEEKRGKEKIFVNHQLIDIIANGS